MSAQDKLFSIIDQASDVVTMKNRQQPQNPKTVQKKSTRLFDRQLMSSRNRAILATSSVRKDDLKPLGKVEYFKGLKENINEPQNPKTDRRKINKTQTSITQEERKKLTCKDDILKELELICITADSKLWSNKIEALCKI